MSGSQCPWCGASRRRAFTECPDSCGWSAAGHQAALAAVTVGDEHFAATGSNPAFARESLAMALRAAGLDPTAAAAAPALDAPDVGPWSFHGHGGAPYVDVSRPGAAVVDVVDWWDAFDFNWVRVEEAAEFLALCRRWLIDWSDKFERTGE